MTEDVRSSFARVAANYTRAKYHSSPEGLREVLELARPQLGDLALDVATGTGHVALALAPHVRRVYGLDLTREMLDQARRVTVERDVMNVEWVIGDAVRLPFADETFDLYTVRAAPHMPCSSTARLRCRRAMCCTRSRSGATRRMSCR